VSLINVSVSYDRQTVLKNFSLEVNEGDFISIIGKSGVGKSTILNLILGDIIPDSGNVIFPENRLVNKTIVFQEYNKTLFPWYDVAKNLKILTPKSASSKDIDFYLELVGLEKHKHKFPWQLSGGMQQRLVLARAVMLKPTLLLLDEPFGSLDYSLKDDLEDEIFALYKKMNLTVVNVTHDIESALFLSNKICFINDGGESFESFEIQHENFKDKAIIRASQTYKNLHNLINLE
jgi:NitT/TauT family transport system ATP-binding protein